MEGWRDKSIWTNVGHTTQVIVCTIAIAEIDQVVMGMTINMGWPIAGTIFHDIGKTLMCDEKTKEPTAIGKLLPQSTYTVYFATKYRSPTEIMHMISTHTVFSV